MGKLFVQFPGFFLILISLVMTITGCSNVFAPELILKPDDVIAENQNTQATEPSQLLPNYPIIPITGEPVAQAEATQVNNAGVFQNGPSTIFLPIIHKMTSWYVSLSGNNTDGRSWQTAWNELDQIRWGVVNPGDTIIIAGGEYHTTMEVRKSGSPGFPITITTNGERVVIDGQRPTLPYCGQTNYTSPTFGGDGIDLEGRSNIIIDGLDWSGIIIKHTHTGIRLRERVSNIIVRNVEIFDNGWSSGSGTSRRPDGPGVDLGGSNILFERVIIHDNGQDAFQAGWGVWNFTLRDSWLYNSREHPTVKGKPFNYCQHSDGIQIYDGGVQGPVLVENSIIGPSFTQGIMIDKYADIDNALIRNSLFVGNQNAGINLSDGGGSTSWILQNVTVFQITKGNISLRGANHSVTNSVFMGGPEGIKVENWVEANGNFYWDTTDEDHIAVKANPMFLDYAYNGFQGAGFAEFNFTIQNPAIPAGTGSSIVSTAQLLGQ